jgi:inorganic pyrophosphatase
MGRFYSIVSKAPKTRTLKAPTLVPASTRGETLRVIVETPRGSRNKYAYNQEEGIYELSRVMPVGMVFPFDFGFVPGTVAEDGDPLDILLLMDEPAFPGCLVECRLLGVIEGEQEGDGGRHRNDRVLGIEVHHHFYDEFRDVDHLPEQLVHEIGEFFMNYHRIQGRRFRVLGVRGQAYARKLVQRFLRAA